MRVPLSWLKDFAPFEQDVIVLADTLSDLGLVVEGVEHIGERLDEVLVAKVLDIAPIPGADKIRSITVDAGRGEERIVCGAWNFHVGDHVPMAPIGTVLPNGMEIGRRKIRGIESNGMLCSGRELGLSEDQEGLLVLDRLATTPGVPLSDAIGIKPDAVFDLALEGNRPDALSIFGVARDLAARLGIALYDHWRDGRGWHGGAKGGNGSGSARPTGRDATPRPDASGASEDQLPGNAGLDELDELGVYVKVSSTDLCPRFTASVFSNIVVKESPAWLVRRLTLAGMRSINNVVDASNYVMLELGQPTHPYDLDLLASHTIRVRAARKGEKLTTLDGVERTLGARSVGPGDGMRDCVICDGDDVPIGVAGIMGGASTEISMSTVNVLLEAAYFQPMAIARTSKRLALRSEASVRFERGCDPYALGRAASRFYDILLRTYEEEFSGHATTSGHEASPDRPGPFAKYLGGLDIRGELLHPQPIRVSASRLNALLGTDLAIRDIADRLERIGFKCTRLAAGDAGEALDVVPPSYRPDVLRDADVAEEVARHIGYSSIVPCRPRSPKVGRLTGYQRRRRLLREVIAGMGVFEAWCASIVDPEDHRTIGLDGLDVVVENPLNIEESVLRRSLLPGLLRSAGRNIGVREDAIRLFEIGRIFPYPDPERVNRAMARSATQVLDEREMCGVLFAWSGDGVQEALQMLANMSDALGLQSFDIFQHGYADALPLASPAPSEIFSLAGLNPSRSGLVVVAGGTSASGTTGADSRRAPESGEEIAAGTAIGVAGEVDPAVLTHFHAGGVAAYPDERRVGWLQLDLGMLLGSAPRKATAAAPVSKYPSTDIDLSFMVPQGVSASKLSDMLESAAGDILESVRLVDVYRFQTVDGDDSGEAGTVQDTGKRGKGSATGSGMEVQDHSGARSLTFRIRLSSLDHTLTDSEIAAARSRCIEALERDSGSVLRG
ncbi:MAG: phenylalanine--tRNA ligase subunit beta [Acidimicrobiales bacterium]